MWAASDLPVERKDEGPLRAGQLIRRDVVVCGLTDTVADVSRRIADSPYGFALVTSPGGVLLGRLRRSACDVPLDTLVEASMEPGPSTVRPHVSAEKLVERLNKRGFKTAVVTTPEGELLGVVRCADLERASGD